MTRARRRFGARAAIGLAALAVAAADRAAIAQPLAAAAATPPPVIDGSLADPAWTAARPGPPFVQRTPTPGAAPDQPSDVRVLHGDGVLYVGVRMTDRAPERIRRVLGRRDSIQDADRVTVYVDPLQTGQRGFFFSINAAGTIGDGVVFNQTETDRSWDAIWTGAAHVDGAGWTAELAIPLTTIPFQDAPAQRWGVYVERFVSRTQETSGWPALPPGGNLFVSRFGELAGLVAVRRPSTVQLQPYAAGTVRLDDQAPGGDPRVFTPNAGLDVRFSPTPTLRLVLAVNPDFGEVDQDPDTVNLAPTEVFFEERRGFFSAGLDLFRTVTPPARAPFLFLHTRRIGAALPPTQAAGRTLVPADPQRRILGAVKILGEAGRAISYGVISVLEEPARALELVASPIGGPPTVVEHELAPWTHYGVLRGQHRLGRRSYVGALATAVNRIGETDERVQPSGELTADTDAYVGVVDWLLRADSGRQLAGFVSTSSSREGLGVAGFLQAGQLGFREWIYKTELELYSGQYEINDAGFSTRRDLLSAIARVDRQIVKPWRGLRRGGLALTSLTELGFEDPGQLQRQFFRLSGDATTRGSWSLAAELGYDLPRTDPLETRGGPPFPRPGRVRAQATVGSDPGGAWWATATGRLEREGAAWRWNPTVTASALLLDRWTISLLAAWRANRGDPFYLETVREQGPPQHIVGDLDFDETEARLTTTYGVNRVLTLQVFAQVLRAVGRYQRFRELVEAPDGDVSLVDSDFPLPRDFVRVSVSSNSVLRWDLGGGTAALLAYRAERALRRQGPAAPFATREGFDTLLGEGLAQTLLLKISYSWDVR